MHGFDNKVGDERERVGNERKELGTQSPPVDSSFLYIFLYLFLILVVGSRYISHFEPAMYVRFPDDTG